MNEWTNKFGWTFETRYVTHYYHDYIYSVNIFLPIEENVCIMHHPKRHASVAAIRAHLQTIHNIVSFYQRNHANIAATHRKPLVSHRKDAANHWRERLPVRKWFFVFFVNWKHWLFLSIKLCHFSKYPMLISYAIEWWTQTLDTKLLELYKMRRIYREENTICAYRKRAI